MLLAALPPAPVVLLTGADLWMDDGKRAESQSGRALALKGGRIAAVGPEAILRNRFPGARVCRLPGGTLLPGFIEGHCHVEALGGLAAQADLGNAATLEEALGRVKAWAAGHPGDWLEGRGWDQNLWPSKAFPSAAELDAVTGERPAALRRVDGHALWANSAALARADITDATPDPAGGRILRDGRGHATGLLLDNAVELVTKIIPAPTRAQREARLRSGLDHLRRLGFTSACDMGGDDGTLAAYRRLAAASALPIRVFAYFDRDPGRMRRELARAKPHQISFFQVQGVKFYLDGALGSRGARLLEPYSDAPGVQGLWLLPPGDLAPEATRVLRAGYQPAVHAIGDAANRAALEALGRAHAACPASPAPRVEHAQIVAPQDARAFGKTGLVASVQPMHLADDHAWTPARLGQERLDRAFPWRAFLEGGAALVFGSDAPIADANPFAALAAAETRQDAAGDPPTGFRPEHRLTRAEALRAYTSASARVLGHPELGVLRRGAVADLLWVQAPLLALDAAALRRLKPGRVWVNGREVKLEAHP